MSIIVISEVPDDLAHVIAFTSNLHSVVVLLLHVILHLTIAYVIFDYAKCCACNFHTHLTIGEPIRVSIGIPVDTTEDNVATTNFNFKAIIDGTYTYKHPPDTFNQIEFAKRCYSVKSFDNGEAFCLSRASNYREYSCKSKISGASNVKIVHSIMQETKMVTDKRHDFHHKRTKPLQEVSLQANCPDNNLQATLHGESGLAASTLGDKHTTLHAQIDIKNESNSLYAVKQKDMGLLKQVKRELPELSKRQIINEQVKPSQEKLPLGLQEPKKLSIIGYNKCTYAVLVRNSVKVCKTKIFASFPHNKFMVEEKHQNSSGVTGVKLILKSTERER